MDQKELILTSTCKLVCIEYETKDFSTDIVLEYVERSPDHWYSDSTTVIDIDKEMAIKIVKFLKEAYEL